MQGEDKKVPGSHLLTVLSFSFHSISLCFFAFRLAYLCMPFSSVLELLHTRKVTRAALTVVGLAPKFRVVSEPPSSTNIMPDLALLRSFELTEILSEGI